VSDRGRGRLFAAGVVAGAATTLLLTTKEGRGLCRKLAGSVRRSPSPDGLVEVESVAWEDAEDADVRSEALRRKIEETRRRLREQVGLPPEE